MFDRQSLHIALLMWGCIFNLIAALCMFMSKNFDRQKRKWMLCMQLSSAVLLGSDAVAWAFRGVSGQTGHLMVRISNFLVFALSDVMLLLFHGYVCCYLFEKVKPGKRQNLRIKAVYLIALTGIFLVVLSQFTHFYYYFDADNFYHRNPAYVLSSIIPMAGLLLDLSLLIQYRKNISGDIFVSMLSYIALPVLAMVAQIFYYGFSLINLSICIAMILMFVVSMVEQNRNLAYKEKEAGVGFNPKEKRDDGEKHVGLINVSNRLESMCHGKLEYRSRVGAGTIGFVSREGKGSVFSVTLPLKVDLDYKSEENTEEIPDRIDGIHILMAEDNE